MYRNYQNEEIDLHHCIWYIKAISLIDKYNSMLSDLLKKHAPIITWPLSSNTNKPWCNSLIHAFKSFCRRLERTYNWSHSPFDLWNPYSVTNRYHIYTTASSYLPQKKYYSNISTSSSNPQKLWKTINDLVHCKCTKSLPQTISVSQLAESFANFLSGKFSRFAVT